LRLIFPLFSEQLFPIDLQLRRHAAWWTLSAGLALTVALGWELQREALVLDRQRLTLRVAEIQGQLDARIEKGEALLASLRDFLTWSGETREEVFQRWCYENGLTINCPWLLGIAVATNSNSRPWPSRLPKPSEPWTDEEFGLVLQEVERAPVDCRLALKSKLENGLQFLSDYGLQRSFEQRSQTDQKRQDRLAVAIRSSSLGMAAHQIVMSGPETNQLIGAMLYQPIYRPELTQFTHYTDSKDTTDESMRKRVAFNYARWLLLSAVILAPLDFNALVESVWQGAEGDLGIEIFSSSNQVANTWMNPSRKEPRAIDPHFKAYLTHRQIWPVQRHKLSFFFYTTPHFEAQSPRRLARIVVVAGVAITLLSSTLVALALRARHQQELLTEQIRDARDALAAAHREREKFRHDLHDGTIQSLYAIQLGLGHTIDKLREKPAHARSELSSARRELDGVIAEIRQFITAEGGRQKSVDLSAVLEAMVQRGRQGASAKVDLVCDPEASKSLTGNQAVQLANIAREVFSNSLRHGKPQRISIALRCSIPGAVLLEVFDDGIGFDPKAPTRSGVGLVSIAARTQEIGGTLELESAPGKGTRVVVRIPASLNEMGDVECSSDTKD
jgi:signal transduction histidine kinase